MGHSMLLRGWIQPRSIAAVSGIDIYPSGHVDGTGNAAYNFALTDVGP